MPTVTNIAHAKYPRMIKYLIQNEEHHKTKTIAEILDILERTFNVTVSRSTLYAWIKKYDLPYTRQRTIPDKPVCSAHTTKKLTLLDKQIHSLACAIRVLSQEVELPTHPAIEAICNNFSESYYADQE